MCICSNTRISVGVVFPMQRMVEEREDEDLDASGYLKLMHVPSTEDVSKVDGMADDEHVEKKSGGSERERHDHHEDELDGDGCLILRHDSTPKTQHELDDADSQNHDDESCGVSTTSPQTEPDREQCVDKSHG